MALYIDKNIYVGDTGVKLSAVGDIGGKAPKAHASSGTTYGVGTTANYGHCRVINNLTTSSATNGYALQAYQGKVLKDLITALTERVAALEELLTYSNTEKAVGTWIDGRTIYRRTLTQVVNSNSTATIDITGWGYNNVWINHGMTFNTYDGQYSSSASQWANNPSSNSDYGLIYIQARKYINIKNQSGNQRTYYITVEYTK